MIKQEAAMSELRVRWESRHWGQKREELESCPLDSGMTPSTDIGTLFYKAPESVSSFSGHSFCCNYSALHKSSPVYQQMGMNVSVKLYSHK
jgi:hypothetical protein